MTANLAALDTVQTLMAERRPASPAEQQILAAWSSWGAQGLSQMFDEDRPEYQAQREQLRSLLTPAEYDAARRTTVNAHYTDPAYVQAMWTAVEALGFTGGRVLEPGCGSGTFIGSAPAAAQMTGVELDPVTAQIAAHLYPQASIRAESFATTRLPDGWFDLTIGNVPFADVTLHDPGHNHRKLSIHNHFVYKSLALTRPGGMVAVLTSRYTLDGQDETARRAFHDLGDLVGAVRLPNGAHQRTAGTDAVTDLVIFRRREADRPPAEDPAWIHTRELTLTGPDGEQTARLNRYFDDHPERVLGDLSLRVGQYASVSLHVDSNADRTTIVATLAEQLRGIVDDATRDQLLWSPSVESVPDATVRFALPTEMDGHLTAHPDGSFTVVEAGVHVPQQVPRTQATEVRRLLELRDMATQLVNSEASEQTAIDVDGLRHRLADRWQAYVDTYGPINRVKVTESVRVADGEETVIHIRTLPPAVRLVLRTDPYGPLVAALEVFDEKAQTASPAALLKARQVVTRPTRDHADDPADALAIVLDRTGRVDVDQIADLLNTTPADAVAALGAHVFEIPHADDAPATWVPAAEYLSGDVRAKLEQAQAADIASPGRWTGHVTALEAVIPSDLMAGDITPRVGAVWIPDTDHQDFLREILDDQWAVVRNIAANEWAVEGSTWSTAAKNTWGTQAVPAPRLFEKMLSQAPITVYDTLHDGRQVVNATETEAAQAKASEIQERFAGWVWEEPERAQRLLHDYNRRFNAVRLRDYTDEGNRLTLPGLAAGFVPMGHQRAAVARMINEKSVGLFHEVGAGKTAEMVIGATELKRLGLVQKPLLVVPDHMLEQVTREWLQLYPQAKLLAASSDDLPRERRRAFVARAATNDWDAIVFTRGAFLALPVTNQTTAGYMDSELSLLREQIAAAQESAIGSVAKSVKRIEKDVMRREEKLKSLLDKPTDPGISFEATGIDYLIVDELHDFKNLNVVSNIQGAAITGSKRATDLHMKVEYLRSRHGDRVMTGATATPIANSITEMYVMQRYLDPEGMAAAGIRHFDQWAATFGEVVTSMEINITGTGFRPKSRFAKFTNVPELLAMFHRFGDVMTAEDLNLPVPAIAPRSSDGQRLPEILTVPKSPQLAQFIRELDERVDQIRSRGVQPGEDNMLRVSTHGRLAALDLRLVLPDSITSTIDPAHTKVWAAADRIAEVWAANKDRVYLDPASGEPSPIRGAFQLVFCDLSTPQPDQWNVYEGLRDALYDRGLPLGSVRFIHEARNDAEKGRLFAECRSGHVAVLIGSTGKMGVGTNVQNRAVHLLDMDAPWRPADVIQRHGRIIRQLNQNTEVQLTQVLTEGSFDAIMWQTLERKAAFIDQIMSGRVKGREVEDIGGSETVLSFAEFKAISSGNPLLLELANADRDVQRYQRLRTAWERNEASMQQTVRSAETAIPRLHTRIAALTEAADRLIPTRGDQFRMTIHGHTYSSRADAAGAFERCIQREATNGYLAPREPGPFGEIAGQSLSYSQNPRNGITVHFDGLDLAVTDQLNDVFKPKLGFVQRLEHVAAGIPEQIHLAQAEIRDRERNRDQAQANLGKPFRHANELAEAVAHQARIEAQVNAVNNPTPAPQTVTSLNLAAAATALAHAPRPPAPDLAPIPARPQGPRLT